MKSQDSTLFDVFVWPFEETHTSPGVILGWANEPKGKDSRWPYHALICAGVLPVSENERLSSQIGAINDKLQVLKSQCTTLQDHEMETNVDQICYSELRIVGTWNIPRSREDVCIPSLVLQDGLPTIYSKADRIYETCQTVFYLRDSRVIYRHSMAQGTSFFAREILTRLTHAQQVLATILTDDQPNAFKKDTDLTPLSCTNRKKSLTSRVSHYILSQRRISPCLVRLLSFEENEYLAKRAKSNSEWLDALIEHGLVQRVLKYDKILRCATDLILGTALGVGLWYALSGDDGRNAGIRILQLSYDLLATGIHWLEQNPIGFKLNQPLTEGLGKELLAFVRFHEKQMLHVLDSTKFWYLVANFCPIIGALSGITGLITAFHAGCMVLSSHVLLLFWCFRSVYCEELRFLAALWRVFRGKKYNVLRQRTDRMDYDSMQLLLGTILFAVSLFLFTTLFVYHVFFASLAVFIGLGSSILVDVHRAVDTFPFGSILFELVGSFTVTDTVYLQKFDSEKAFRLSFTKLSPTMAVVSAAGLSIMKFVSRGLSQPVQIARGRPLFRPGIKIYCKGEG